MDVVTLGMAKANAVKAAASAVADGAAPRPSALQAQQWDTNEATPFTPVTPAAFADVRTLPSGNIPLVVRPDAPAQSVIGHGAAITGSTAYLLRTRMTKAQRTALLTELFSPDANGFSVVRVGIGGTDFDTVPMYSLDVGMIETKLSADTAVGDTTITTVASIPSGTALRIGSNNLTSGELVTTSGAPTGTGPYTIPVPALANAHTSGDLVVQADMTSARIQVLHEYAHIIPVILEILKINPAVRVIGSVWIPPSFMRTATGTTASVPWTDAATKTAFATYIVQALTLWATAGIILYGVAVQNEPCSPTASIVYYAPDQMADLIGNYVGPALESAGISTLLMLPDHHYNFEPWVELAMDSTAGPITQYVKVVPFHAYGGTPSYVRKIRRRYPTAIQLMSEFRTLMTQDWSASMAVMAGPAMVTYMRNGGQGVVLWNLALDENGGPATVSPGRRGVITIASDGSGAITYSAEYYALKHLAQVAKPGARMIDTPQFLHDAAPYYNVLSVAFLNPDGTVGVMIYNSDSVAWDANVIDARTGQGFTVHLLAGQITSALWGVDHDARVKKNAYVPAVPATPTTTPALVQSTAFADTTGGAYRIGVTYVGPTVTDGLALVAVQAGMATDGTVGYPFGATYGGVPMKYAGVVSNQDLTTSAAVSVALFYLVNPPAGSVTVRTYTDRPMNQSGILATFQNVNQTDPVSISALAKQLSGTSLSAVLPAGASTDLCVSVAVANGAVTPAVGTGQTSVQNTSSTTTKMRMSTQVATPQATATYTLSASASMVLCGVLLHGA